MRRVGLLVLSITFVSTASAQQTQQSPAEQALSSKLSREISEGLQLSTALVQERQKSAELERQLAEIKKTCPAKQD